MSEPLWRKESHHFIVEIQVGATWVQHTEHMLLDEAHKAAKEALTDRSVSKVRICEHEITHRCSMLFEDSTEEVIQLPPKMASSGRSEPCPRCSTSSQVATDGTNEWIFCARCKSAFPA